MSPPFVCAAPRAGTVRDDRVSPHVTLPSTWRITHLATPIQPPGGRVVSLSPGGCRPPACPRTGDADIRQAWFHDTARPTSSRSRREPHHTGGPHRGGRPCGDRDRDDRGQEQQAPKSESRGGADPCTVEATARRGAAGSCWAAPRPGHRSSRPVAARTAARMPVRRRCVVSRVPASLWLLLRWGEPGTILVPDRCRARCDPWPGGTGYRGAGSACARLAVAGVRLLAADSRIRVAPAPAARHVVLGDHPCRGAAPAWAGTP